MAAIEGKELQAREKQEVASPAEQTAPGIVFTPDVDIYETEKALKLLADMPGVKADDLTIDLREDTLTISGNVAPGEKTQEKELYMEYETGRYHRQFTLGQLIDQSEIDAKLTDGVLHLTLPKVEKATPKKISVRPS